MPASGDAIAQRKSKKSRDTNRAGEPLLVGTLYRGTPLVPDCVKQREAVLFKDKFGTYGKNGPDGRGTGTGWVQGRKHKPLDKVWVFAAHHRVTPLKQRKFSALEAPRKRASLLSALTSDHYVERELHTFTLKSEVGRKDSSKAARVERLDLAFESSEDALLWRRHITEQIAAIRRRDRPSLADAWDTADSAEAGTPPGVRQREAGGGGGGGRDGADGSAQLRSGDLRGESGSEASSDDAMATPLGSPRGGRGAEGEGRRSSDTISDDEQPSVQSLAARTSSIELLQRELRSDARLSRSPEDWKVVSYESGITVLRGAGDHNADSVMLSYIIRASPRLSVKTLLNRVEQRIQVGSLTVTLKVVDTVDSFNDVLETVWYPAGIGALFVAPRILRIRRLWRREDDGTYVVIFRAVDPPQAPQQPRWWHWFVPVPCQLIDTCYTFSPLQSEFTRRGDSEETLVTHVSCYGDLGGWLGRGHPWRRLFGWLAPLAAPEPLASLLHPLLESSIAIRNKAESERFCTRTFLQSHSEGSARALPPGSPAGSSGRGGAGLQAVEASGPLPPPTVFAAAEPCTEEAGEAGAGPSCSRRSLAGGGAAAADAPDSLAPLANGNGGLARGSPTPADVATCERKYWDCPGANNLKVRGPGYLKNRKKVPAGEPEFVLAAADLLQVAQPTQHIARFLPSLRASRSSFTFIMQIMFGSPSLSLTFSWAAPPAPGEAGDSPPAGLGGRAPSGQALASPSSSWVEDEALDERELLGKPFELCLARFLAGGTDDREANERRHGTLKLIPRISQGPWFVKQAVGTTPCLLGRKLAAHYHRGPGYFEVDLDVSSSSVAANIVGLVQGMTKALCVDMAIVLEGHAPEELPEALLGTVRCSHLDLGSAKLLDVETGEITEKPRHQ